MLLTQKEIASMCGCSYDTIHAYFGRGEFSNIPRNVSGQYNIQPAQIRRLKDLIEGRINNGHSLRAKNSVWQEQQND